MVVLGVIGFFVVIFVVIYCLFFTATCLLGAAGAGIEEAKEQTDEKV